MHLIFKIIYTLCVSRITIVMYFTQHITNISILIILITDTIHTKDPYALSWKP
jgi:hypothetical protein